MVWSGMHSKLSRDDIEQWIDNDESLYNWWRSEHVGKREFIKRHHDELARAITDRREGRKPGHQLSYESRETGAGWHRFTKGEIEAEVRNNERINAEYESSGLSMHQFILRNRRGIEREIARTHSSLHFSDNPMTKRAMWTGGIVVGALLLVGGVAYASTRKKTSGGTGASGGGGTGASGGSGGGGGGVDMPAECGNDPTAYDLNTVKGVQCALTYLSKKGSNTAYDPKAVNGATSPITLAAIKAFQKDHGLDVDGIVGPKTRAALHTALFPVR